MRSFEIGNGFRRFTFFDENFRSMFDFPEGTKSAIFGMGCFWGVERLFWNQNPNIYTTQGIQII